MWDMILTCNDTLHCICTGTLHFMGVGAWLGLNTEIVDLMSVLGTVGRGPTKSHDCMKRKNCIRVIARRVRHSPG